MEKFVVRVLAGGKVTVPKQLDLFDSEDGDHDSLDKMQLLFHPNLTARENLLSITQT